MTDHWIVVSEATDAAAKSYSVEHHETCPTWTHEIADGVVVSGYACHVGSILHEAGEYAIEGWEDLAPGRYLVEAWFSHQPSTPNGPEEWDAGVCVYAADGETVVAGG